MIKNAEPKSLKNSKEKSHQTNPPTRVSNRTDGRSIIAKSSTVFGDDLILVPNGKDNNHHVSNEREFELGDCFDFIHAGIEAIIEDDVTQRFVAEELKVCSFKKNGKKFITN